MQLEVKIILCDLWSMIYDSFITKKKEANLRDGGSR